MRCVPGTTTVVVVSVAVMKSLSSRCSSQEASALVQRRSRAIHRVPRPRRPLVAARSLALARSHSRHASLTATILILCTGNATRSVIAGAVLAAHVPDVEVVTSGTLSIDGLPMSWRTRAGFEAVGVDAAAAPQPPGVA